MNILFLTMNSFTDIEMHNIYSDLMKVFIENGHRPYIVTPRERRSGGKTELLKFDTYLLLKVKIGNTSGVSLIEKGVSTIALNSQYYKAITKYLGDVAFDLILYSTPPITLVGSIEKLKKQYHCRTYLLLKDIFPQNAVDLNMFPEGSLIHGYFRSQEKKLYMMSDRIGCMSPANMRYILKQNPEMDKNIVEVCPNGIIPNSKVDRSEFKRRIREKYEVPDNAVLYLYGGNLGRPQGIPHLISCLNENIDKPDRFFIICGSGSEYHLIEEFISEKQPDNIRLINFLPKTEYDILAAGCDVGLIFLDSRFTIPNYPSRILSYMENEMPVIICADSNTDVGTEAQENGYGLFCCADNPKKFSDCIDKMNAGNIEEMGKLSRRYLEENFTSERCYKIIMSHSRDGIADRELNEQ